MKPVKRNRPPIFEDYLALLKQRFSELNPEVQQLIATRMTQVVLVGTTIVLISFVYAFVPLFVRVFMLPVFMLGAWYLAGKSGSILRWVCSRSIKAVMSKLPGAPALSYLGALLVLAFFFVGIIYGAG